MFSVWLPSSLWSSCHRNSSFMNELWHEKHPMKVAQSILQDRILELVAVPFSRGSSQPGDQTRVSCIAGGFFTNWAARERSPFFFLLCKLFLENQTQFLLIHCNNLRVFYACGLSSVILFGCADGQQVSFIASQSCVSRVIGMCYVSSKVQQLQVHYYVYNQFQ